MATWEFPGSDPIDLDLSIVAGTAVITAASTDLVTVSVYRSRRDAQLDTAAVEPEEAETLTRDVRVEFADGRLKIAETEPKGLRWMSRSLHYLIGVPTGSRCTVHAVSADVTIEGEVGSLDATTASGHVEVQAVHGPAQATTISGNISAGLLTGEAGLQTASGMISVRQAAGDVTARTVSGMVKIGSAAQSVTARTASGRVRVDSVASGRSDVNTVSGDIELKVAPRTGVFLDLSSMSGRVTSDLEPSGAEEQTDLCVQCRSVSGAVHVARAIAAEVAS